MYNPKAKTYFSGCEGMGLGLMQAGIEIIQSLDMDRDAIECLSLNSHYFDHKILHADIKSETIKGQPDSDIIVGTYPCNKYSEIGDLFGTRTGDDLFLHFFRHIALLEPEMYIIENVPGMLKFQVVMEAITKLPRYYVNVICPVDALNWLPQSRERVIVIGTKKPFQVSPPSSIKRKISISDILEKDPVYEMKDHIINRINGKYRDKPIIVDPDQPGAFAPTCVAHYAKDQGTRLVKDKNAQFGVRPFTKREYARLQGFPDDFIFPDKLSSYKLIGNAVPVNMGRWAGEQAMKYFN